MNIDWGEVRQAIEQEGLARSKRPLASFDLDDAVDLVKLAAGKWLPEDLALFCDPVFEVSFRQETSPGVIIKGILDVFGERRLAAETKLTRPFVVDWKTRQTADVDSDWEKGLRDSAQWRIYAWASRAPIFVYRGISRRSRKTRNVYIEVPVDNDAWVVNFLKGIAAQHVALMSAGLLVWPQRKPGGCRTFGRPCEYLQDCRQGGQALRPEILRGSRDLSYTSIERFQICAERYRRHALAPEGEYESDDSLFGTAFHSGVAEAWRQSFQDL